MADEEDTKVEDDTRKDASGNILEVGHYEALENDDNSVAVSDPAYVGVSPEYRNYANESDQPLQSEDDDLQALDEAQNEREASLRHSREQYIEQTATHPKDATHPTNVTMEEHKPASPLGRSRKS